MNAEHRTSPRRSQAGAQGMICDHCGAPVPRGVFCTVCGAHQDTLAGVGDPRTRLHRFAAQPGEHVAHPHIFSTLFPHLSHHRVDELRRAFLLSLAVLLVLEAAGLVTAALLGAAVLLPAMYAVYLYEAEVYRDAPVPALALSLGAGAVLGVIVTVVVDRVFNSTALLSASWDAGIFLGLTLLVPVIVEVVKPLPVLLLQSRFVETIDGVVFGIAAGLGFAGAQTMVSYAPVMSVLPAHVSPENWVYPLITAAVTLPLLQGCCSGVITGAIWAIRRRSTTRLEVAGIAVAVIAHIGFTMVSEVMTLDGVQPLLVVAWQLVVVGLVVVYLRFLLHAALLEEATDVGVRETQCINCHRNVRAAGFCPSCGMALSAAPRRAHLGRSVAAGVRP